MKRIICAVKDSAAQVYSNPMFVPATGIAVRGFTDEVRRSDPGNALYNHKSDFILYELGEFDDETGKFDNLEVPRQLIRGADVV